MAQCPAHASGGPLMRTRLASVSFAQREPASLAAFEARITQHVRFASDCGAKAIVFPEYVCSSLLALDARWEAWSEWRLEFFRSLATAHGLHIIGGTHPETQAGRFFNTAHIFSPGGSVFAQRKMHSTPFERTEWNQTGGDTLHLFRLPFGLAAVAVCYDIEFPELVRAAARAGAQVLFVPSWTDDRAGAHRVRYCAAARCVENGLFVVQAPLVGGLSQARFFEQAQGRAAILSPCDIGFPADGVVAEGGWNEDFCLVGEVDFAQLGEARTAGTVTPFADSRAEASYRIEVQAEASG